MARVDERAGKQAHHHPGYDEADDDPTMLASRRDVAPDFPGARARATSVPGEPNQAVLTPKDIPPPTAMSGRYMRLPATFAGAGLFAATIVICLAVKFRDPMVISAIEDAATMKPTTAPRPAPSGSSRTTGATSAAAAMKEEAAQTTTAAELDRAQAGGLAALLALSQRYPNDPAVLEALVLAHGRERAYLAAMQTTKRLFDLAPEKVSNDDIRQLILRSANGTPDVAAVAFEVMTKKMGKRGPDLLYEVVTLPQFGDYPRDKASKLLLLDEDVRRIASPAVLIADELRRMTACPTKAVLVKAGEQGDQRARQYLKQLVLPQRCGLLGFRTCLKCATLHKDIRAASGAIDKRLSAALPSSPAPASSRP